MQKLPDKTESRETQCKAYDYLFTHVDKNDHRLLQ